MSTPKPSSPILDIEEIKKQIGQMLISWGAPGLGLGLTVHYAQNAQWQAAAIALIASIFIWFVIKLFQQIDPRINKLLEWWVNNLERWLIQRWWEVTSQFQAQYYKSLIYTYRDFRTQGLKTKGPFTLDLEKVFVPLRVAPESADRTSSAMLPTKETIQPLEIWDFLAKSQQPVFKRIVVLGPPGSGKTTLLEHLTLAYARNALPRSPRRVPRLIPILLYLRDLQTSITPDSFPNLVELISQQSLIQRLNPHSDWFSNQLKQGKCLVMLDGLDEIADARQRQLVSQWVDRQMSQYPDTTFIVTSRPFGYRSAPLEQVGTVLEVQPFNLLQMQQFIRNWYLQNEVMSRLGKDDPGVRQTAEEKATDLIDRIQQNPPLAAMALNPLLLTMIATVHNYRGALPGRRVELYAEICDVLLGRRQDAKGIPDSLSAIQKRSVLQVLALKGMQRKTREFKIVTACLLIRQRLIAVAGTEADPEAFLQRIENVSGLLVEREQGTYEFAHRSFQEYLAATQVKDLQQDYLLSKHIDDPWWDETIRLFAAQSDASNLIWAALQRMNVVALTLAYDCLEEGLSVQPDVRRKLESTLEAGLESTDPELFQLAAEVKLSRRLNRLLRVDETIEIDTRYITCAEYQLFIDEKRQLGEHRQPDHWLDDRFRPGDANQPITGVRADDVEEFCAWLTQRTSSLGDTYLEAGSPVFVGNFKLRSPTPCETEAYPIQPSAWKSIRIVRERIRK
jgi:predicted NACHT family NTPase